MTVLRYLSLCSGIEAASVAFAPMGWEPVAFAEIEPFPSAVLAHHYPNVPNLGDITKFKEWPDLGTVDIVCGGTPCQSFSVAGLRKGLADPRGNLSLTFLAIVDRYRPRYVIWENVPGVLSSNGGRDFAAFLGGLGQLGYGWCYRVLDAQFCRVDGFPRAVPQRRRRVFVVGYLGDWRRAAAVLSEPESVLGDSPPRRQAGERPASSPRERSPRGGWPADVAPTLGTAWADRHPGSSTQDFVSQKGGLFVPAAYGGGNRSGPIEVAASLAAHGVRQDFEVETFIASRPVAATLTRGTESSGKGGYAGRRQEDDDNLVAWPLTSGMSASAARMPHEQGALLPIAIQERAISENAANGPDGVGVRQDGAAYTLEARQVPQAVAFAQNNRDEVRLQGGDGQIVGALAAEPGMKQTTYVQQGWAVRRLTPTECERLMGFPDGYTAIPHRGKPAADGPRYKALGNSWAVNCARWVGRRIEMVEQIATEIDQAAAA